MDDRENYYLKSCLKREMRGFNIAFASILVVLAVCAVGVCFIFIKQGILTAADIFDISRILLIMGPLLTIWFGIVMLKRILE